MCVTCVCVCTMGMSVYISSMQLQGWGLHAPEIWWTPHVNGAETSDRYAAENTLSSLSQHQSFLHFSSFYPLHSRTWTMTGGRPQWVQKKRRRANSRSRWMEGFWWPTSPKPKNKNTSQNMVKTGFIANWKWIKELKLCQWLWSPTDP